MQQPLDRVFFWVLLCTLVVWFFAQLAQLVHTLLNWNQCG